MKHFSAKGKFLFSGEYLVLEGAKAFATPLRYGQTLQVENTENNIIVWTSTVKNHDWFTAELNNKLEVVSTNNKAIAERLSEILNAVLQLNPSFKSEIQSGIDAKANMEFDQEWGLGSSSTLIALISQWANVDPYKLLELTFGGSGYDIACATQNQPVFYTKTENGSIVEKVDYDPVYKDQMFFIYSGQKSNSRTGMKYFRSNAKWGADDVNAISSLSEQWSKAKDVATLMTIIDEHEIRMSKILNLPALKGDKFDDFEGSIKSLGAWGGDFFLAVSPDAEYLKNYFKTNYDTILSYDKIVHFNPETVTS